MIISQCTNQGCRERGVRHQEDDTLTLEDGTVVDLLDVPTVCGVCGGRCDKTTLPGTPA